MDSVYSPRRYAYVRVCIYIYTYTYILLFLRWSTKAQLRRESLLVRKLSKLILYRWCPNAMFYTPLRRIHSHNFLFKSTGKPKPLLLLVFFFPPMPDDIVVRFQYRLVLIVKSRKETGNSSASKFLSFQGSNKLNYWDDKAWQKGNSKIEPWINFP